MSDKTTDTWATIGKMLAALLMILAAFGAEWYTHKYGWGLTVASWPALIAGVFATAVIYAIAGTIRQAGNKGETK